MKFCTHTLTIWLLPRSCWPDNNISLRETYYTVHSNKLRG